MEKAEKDQFDKLFKPIVILIQLKIRFIFSFIYCNRLIRNKIAANLFAIFRLHSKRYFVQIEYTEK